MRPTAQFIRSLENLQEGERSRLRRLAGQPLDSTLQGFDLFTGLWWPLRAQNAAAPRREPSWIIAKVFAAFPVPNIRPDNRVGPSLPMVLGSREPRDDSARARFRTRFDYLLCSPLSSLELHLRWAVGEVARQVSGQSIHAPDTRGIDWVQLLDDLSLWDHGRLNQAKRVQEFWAEAYLNAANSFEWRR